MRDERHPGNAAKILTVQQKYKPMRRASRNGVQNQLNQKRENP
jgi:hypothetical protein